MSTDRSREGLARFLDFLGEKGLVPRTTAQTRKASSLQLLSLLNDEEAKDVTNIDVDNLAIRFSNLRGQNYTPESINSYRSRLRSSLADFRSYLENPLSFKPAVQQRERVQRSKKEDGEPSKNIHPEARAEPSRSSAMPVMAGANIMPIPLRANLTILIHGLPHDLTQAEARRISGVINALAIEA